jgi:endonuclease YncB( thermonuclease family)
MRLTLTSIMFIFFSAVSYADTLTGRVIRVVEGDALVVQDSNNAQHEIRLLGIDAPEYKQAYAAKSTESLTKWVAGRFVVIDYSKRDDHERIIGKLLLSGQDINLEQIKAGLAWYDNMHAEVQTESDRQLYVQVELEARKAKRGIWFDINPVPPWVFRNKR